MYPAYWCSTQLLALMEYAHTEPHKAFSHEDCIFTRAVGVPINGSVSSKIRARKSKKGNRFDSSG